MEVGNVIALIAEDGPHLEFMFHQFPVIGISGKEKVRHG